jgi:sensor histidine kinase YesM
MIPQITHSHVQMLYNNRNCRFWFFQLTGWLGYALLTFLSITLIDGNVSWPHLGHIALTALLGILTTWPLRPLFARTFNYSISYRVLVAIIAIIVLSATWTVLRVVVFAAIVDRPALWDEFNYWYFGSLFVFLSWTVLYYGIRYYELLTLEHQKLLEETALKRDEHLKRVQAESSAREARLKMLRYQLNPHFLFNTLNSINALVKLRENDKARDMIQLLGDFLRHSLEDGGTEAVTLQQELDSLMLYLNIEKTRFSDRLQLDLDIAPESLQALVPGLILQPIIENAMKYAIAPSEDGGTVRITARVAGDELHLEVSDTGPGMTAVDAGHGRGIGLRNTLDRLEELYESNYSFELSEADPEGLRVCLRIPLEKAPPEADRSTHPNLTLTQCAG